jgi:hypothetical protein
MTKTEAYQDSLQFLGLTKKNGVGVGELYALKPTNNGGNFVWSRALSAYRTNQEGLLELVASGVPRVDYSNTCPELLIEKQSTNLYLKSTSLSHGAWNGTGTITVNDAISPTGALTASTFADAIVYQGLTSLSGSFINSVWLKSASTATVRFFCGADEDYQTIPTDWVLLSYKQTPPSTSENCGFEIIGDAEVWIPQFESGTYATSRIETDSAAVTRPQDKAYNTTIAYGLKGTIFIRARIFSSTYTKVDTLFSLNDETLDDYITCSTNASRSIFITTMGGAIDTNSYNYSLASNGIYSIAIGYDFTGVNNKVNIAINGVLKRANAAQVDNPPVALSRFDLGSLYETLPSVDNRIIGQMYFADQLSDTDLTALTVQ